MCECDYECDYECEERLRCECEFLFVKGILIQTKTFKTINKLLDID